MDEGEEGGEPSRREAGRTRRGGASYTSRAIEGERKTIGRRDGLEAERLVYRDEKLS